MNDLTFESSHSMDTSVVYGTGSGCIVKKDTVQISCNSINNFADSDQKILSSVVDMSDCEIDYQVNYCILIVSLNLVRHEYCINDVRL